MKKNIRSLAMILPLSLFMFTSCDVLSPLDTNNPSTTDLSETDIVSGLKGALVLGAKTAAFTLSDTSGVKNSLDEITGYLANDSIRINLPADAENAFEMLEHLSNSEIGKTLLDAAGIDILQYRESIILGLNRGAEIAAALSVDVFEKAILEMDIPSAQDILFGLDSTAATSYLQSTTSSILTNGFTPIVDSVFNAAMVTAFGEQLTVNDLWDKVSENYNKVATAYQTLTTDAASTDLGKSLKAKATLELISEAGITSIDPLDTDIVSFATSEALDGLFCMVGKQEVKIRRDPVAALTSTINFYNDTVY
ncbi:MAG TPA: DUF4197 domain-containing protein, partial [Chitinispirillaceae bacterium]|nr:DUF4197 domain-containing protein [Chitinispirillaceae bacterium]